MGMKNVRFLIVGHGGDEAWLRERLPQAEFTGVLRGEALATAYANMDLFVFPSHTDTFGNVVLEALASGVPAIVTPDGGPCTIVRDGETGRIVSDDQFTAAIAQLLADPARLAQMRQAARAYALTASWDSVFEGIYAAYEQILLPNKSNVGCGLIFGTKANLYIKASINRSEDRVANGFSRSLRISQPVPRSTPPSISVIVTPSSESFSDSHACPSRPHARIE